jgi:hypothetical protein
MMMKQRKKQIKKSSAVVTTPASFTTTSITTNNPLSNFGASGQVLAGTGTYSQPLYNAPPQSGWHNVASYRTPIFGEIAKLMDLEDILTVAQIEFMDELYTTGDTNNAKIAMQMFKTLTDEYVKKLKAKHNVGRRKLSATTQEKEEVLEKEMD